MLITSNQSHFNPVLCETIIFHQFSGGFQFFVIPKLVT